MSSKIKYKTTQPVSPAYKGAPLGVHDLILQQVRKEQYLFAAPEVTYTEEVMKMELPTQKWTPTAKYVFGNNLIRFALALMP